MASVNNALLGCTFTEVLLEALLTKSIEGTFPRNVAKGHWQNTGVTEIAGDVIPSTLLDPKCLFIERAAIVWKKHTSAARLWKPPHFINRARWIGRLNSFWYEGCQRILYRDAAGHPSRRW